MEDHEYRGYRIPELLERDRFGDIEILRFSIRDMGVPQEAESEKFEAFVQDVFQRLEEDQNVVVHCRGGLGRTGTLAACVLVALGRHTADEAIATVREARKGTVQTREQEDLVRIFGGMIETRRDQVIVAVEDKPGDRRRAYRRSRRTGSGEAVRNSGAGPGQTHGLSADRIPFEENPVECARAIFAGAGYISCRPRKRL